MHSERPFYQGPERLSLSASIKTSSFLLVIKLYVGVVRNEADHTIPCNNAHA